nr:immunoglobulin heavy chain junction region [Macaca mulatta]MOV56860.1 immunoglobulin heavy chain junction region [Macaca mulatta]MOV58908.1 immunoglobulin heavy chain junction region [Macaca mulatta]
CARWAYSGYSGGRGSLDVW